jgi:pimeloyl-ACP methyl ester carboxylesterase
MAEAHPREMAAVVMDGLRAEGVMRPHVAGLSLGGWVVLEMALLGYCASATALAPAGLWRDRAVVKRERQQAALSRLLRVLDPALPPLARLRIVKTIGLRLNVVHPERVTDEQFLAAARALLRTRAYSVCDRAMVRSRFDGGSRIRVPTTVAFGDDDRVLPPDTCQERSLLPDDVTFTVVPSCGHAMSWDQPEACVRLIRQTTARAQMATR